jgi:hypothetical protein
MSDLESYFETNLPPFPSAEAPLAVDRSLDMQARISRPYLGNLNLRREDETSRSDKF